MNATITDRGLKLTAPDRHDDLRAAGTAAVLMAKNLEGRYGDGNDLARMLHTANSFVNDVVRFDTAHGDEPDYDGANGQFIDVLLLGMASGWFSRTIRRDHNQSDRDPEQYEQAAELMCDVWDTAFRQMGINAIGGQLEQVEYRYSD